MRSPATPPPRRSGPLLVLPPLLISAVALTGAGCPGPGTPDAGPTPEGSCTIDGASYRADEAASKVLILVRKKAAGGCGVFHSHVIEAKGYGLNCDIDTANPGASTLELLVPKAALDPDLPENRALFDELDGENLSDGDRAIIYNSTQDALADNGAILTFSASNIGGFDGEGLTVDLGVAINGGTSQTTLTYNAARDGERFLVTDGVGVLDGSQHNIPSGFASTCVQSDLELHLELVLEPGEAGGPNTDAGVECGDPQLFPYEGPCHDEVGWPEVRDILVRRCAGCHDSESAYPLVEYSDFETDSCNYPGQPRFETALELMNLAADESRHMPPISDASQPTAQELATITTWVEAGGPEERCTPLDYPPFEPVARNQECGEVNYTEDVRDIIFFNGCMDCHTGAVADIPAINPDDYSTGIPDVDHPFYWGASAPLSIWQASVERIRDGTMPPDFYGWVPVTGTTKEDDLAVLDAWIADGWPENPCP